ncbi:hypothetical protein CYMTET_22610 [Cymbomonas tetramitiformis]|uniref:Uncharacterized protein n=1 Tax=Cymbomonas tetramitiformis TaxID=36881 RepID=A0AAE0FZJ4_9CHLO|nr:hypothetical protein CYMTET_22610 [Cymbomonas tetramitiformis]
MEATDCGDFEGLDREGAETCTDDKQQPLLAALLTAVVSRVVQGVPGSSYESLQPVVVRAEAVLSAQHRDPDLAAAAVVQEAGLTLSSEATKVVGTSLGTAIAGPVGAIMGLAVGISAAQLTKVWEVARAVSIIASIYGHDVEDTDIQYRIMLCLLDMVVTSGRAPTKPGSNSSKEDKAGGFNPWLKSWGRYLGEAVVSHTLSGFTAVPASVALQALIGFSESSNSAVEAAERAVKHFRPNSAGWASIFSDTHPKIVYLYSLLALIVLVKLMPGVLTLQTALGAALTSALPPSARLAGTAVSWVAAAVAAAGGVAAVLGMLLRGSGPLVKHSPWVLPMLALGAAPLADSMAVFAVSTSAQRAILGNEEGPHSHGYYLHKTCASAVMLWARKRRKQTATSDKLCVLLQGSLITWSVWLSMAVVDSGWDSDYAVPMFDAIATVCMTALMDRLHSPVVLAETIGAGALVHGAASVVQALGVAATHPEPAMKLIDQCSPPPPICCLILTMRTGWPGGALLPLLTGAPPCAFGLLPMPRHAALLVLGSLLAAAVVNTWHLHHDDLHSERRLLLLLPEHSDLKAPLESALNSVSTAQAVSSRAGIVLDRVTFVTDAPRRWWRSAHAGMRLRLRPASHATASSPALGQEGMCEGSSGDTLDPGAGSSGRQANGLGKAAPGLGQATVARNRSLSVLQDNSRRARWTLLTLPVRLIYRMTRRRDDQLDEESYVLVPEAEDIHEALVADGALETIPPDGTGQNASAGDEGDVQLGCTAAATWRGAVAEAIGGLFPWPSRGRSALHSSSVSSSAKKQDADAVGGRGTSTLERDNSEGEKQRQLKGAVGLAALITDTDSMGAPREGRGGASDRCRSLGREGGLHAVLAARAGEPSPVLGDEARCNPARDEKWPGGPGSERGSSGSNSVGALDCDATARCSDSSPGSSVRSDGGMGPAAMRMEMQPNLLGADSVGAASSSCSTEQDVYPNVPWDSPVSEGSPPSGPSPWDLYRKAVSRSAASTAVSVLPSEAFDNEVDRTHPDHNFSSAPAGLGIELDANTSSNRAQSSRPGSYFKRWMPSGLIWEAVSNSTEEGDHGQHLEGTAGETLSDGRGPQMISEPPP